MTDPALPDSASARVEVDEKRCEGHGLCEDAAPELFALDDEGQLIIKQADVPDELLAKAQQAVRSCPVAALRLLTRGAS